jgi:hypothetical protein
VLPSSSLFVADSLPLEQFFLSIKLQWLEDLKKMIKRQIVSLKNVFVSKV